MSDNCNSTVDTIIGGVVIGVMFMGAAMLFPILPGAVTGWEIAKHLGGNKDIMVMSALVGAFVNFGLYQFLLWTFNRSYGTFEKVIVYLIAISSLLLMNLFIDNAALQTFDRLFFETVFFFADFTRWFTNNVLVNIFLFFLYAFAIFALYFFVVGFIERVYYAYKRRGQSQGVRR